MKKALYVLILMCMIGVVANAQTALPESLYSLPTILPSHFSGALEYRDGYTCIRSGDRSFQLLIPKKEGLVLDSITDMNIDVYGWLLASPKLQIVVDKIYLNGDLVIGVKTWDWQSPLFSPLQ